MIGVVLDLPRAKEVVQAALGRGLVLNAPAENVIRVLPPLTISSAEVQEGARILASVLVEL